MSGTLVAQTIQGPSSGANANKVLIPSGHTLDVSGGTLVPSAGAVVQTQQFTYTGSTSWSSVGYVDILIGTVTPKFADSKFLMTIMMRASHVNNWSLYFAVDINGNKDLWSRGAGYPAATGSLYRDQSAVNSQASIDEFNGQYLYTHSGSSDVVITVSGRGQGGTNYMNYAYGYNDESRGRPMSVLTVQEIAQ